VVTTLTRIILRLLFGGAPRLLGRVFGRAFGPVMDKVAGKSGTCPHCGFLVGAQAASCAQCGYSPGLARTVLTMPVVSVSSPAQPPRTGPILPMGQCPNCEEIIPMSSRSCPVCRHTPEPQGTVPA